MGAAVSEPPSAKCVFVLFKEKIDTKAPKQYFEAGTQHVMSPAIFSYILPATMQKPELCGVLHKHQYHLP